MGLMGRTIIQRTMETKTTNRKGQLIRKLHVLRGAAGMTQDEYEALLGSYGVESSKELEEWQLERLCAFIEKSRRGAGADKEKQRKRLLAAVCAFCEDVVPGWEKMDAAYRIGYAKAIACRAAGWEEPWDSHGRSRFNRMGLDRLRSLTYAFQKRKTDMDGVVAAVSDMVGTVADGETGQMGDILPELYYDPKTKTYINL